MSWLNMEVVEHVADPQATDRLPRFSSLAGLIDLLALNGPKSFVMDLTRKGCGYVMSLADKGH